MKQLLGFLFLIFCSFTLNAQNKVIEVKQGTVSFMTSQNIYIRFENTKGITKNDTLYILLSGRYVPALLAEYVSSSSCSGKIIDNLKLSIGAHIYARIINPESEGVTKGNEQNPVLTKQTPAGNKPSPQYETQKKYLSSYKNLQGNFSLSTFSSLSNISGFPDYLNWRINLSLKADSISNSPFSFSSYTNFSFRPDRWGEIKNNIGQAVKVYELALKYQFNHDSRITFGRQINNKVSSLGASDGVQFETSFNNFELGLIVGSRPALTDFGFDIKMFQFGAYIFRSDSLGAFTMQNSLGVFQQTNNFKTDRRYIYLQHNSNLTSGLNVFASSEFDLYKRKGGVEQNVFNMTSLFLMCSYNPSAWLGVNFSYDARKNVMYYETYKTFADSILESAMRQGYSLRLNIRPLNGLFIGGNFGYRFSPDDPRPSRNAGISISYFMLPVLESSLYGGYNWIESGYLNGNYYNLSLNKDLFNGLMNVLLGYKMVDYQFQNGNYHLIQKIGDIDLAFRMNRSLYFTLSYEGTFQEKTSYGRLYLSLNYRF